MASISKLSVRGIRAFSPEDEEQVISFCFPLTIIVGANGCGKTTIIEALKYAVTGALPPGNKSGQAFVHDPKSIGSSVVKAAVKLRFNNRAGKSMVVIRSMELTQKKTTMQFKQLDGIIRTTDESGRKVALSHKCSELDRQVPQLLGVSKSILEHVVFCHQEDSSWPLMAGSDLKKRFDDIFDSTKYVKALDAIKDVRKTYQNKAKDYKTELAELNGHKHAAMGFRNELDHCRQGLSDIHDEMQGYNQQIQEEQAKCKVWGKTLSKYGKIEHEINEKFSFMEQEEVRIETHQKGLVTDMTQTNTKDDLEDKLMTFDRQMQGDVKTLNETKAKVKKSEAKIADLTKQKVELSESRGQLMGEKKLHESNLFKRIELMEELATEYGLELTFSQTQQTDGGGGGIINTQQSSRSRLSISSDWGIDNNNTFSQGSTVNTIQLTNEDLEAFERSVSKKRQQLQQQLDEYRDLSQKEEDSIQTELSNLKAKVTTVEIDLSRLSDNRSKAERELNKIPRTSSRMRKSEIDEARRNAERMARTRDELSRDPRRTEIPNEIKLKADKISQKKNEIEELASILQDLRRCAEEQNSIDILERQVDQDLELIDELKNDHSFILANYHDIKAKLPHEGTEIDSSVSNAMDSIVDEVSENLDSTKTQLDEASEQLKQCESKVSKTSALLSHKQDTLSQRKEQLSLLSSENGGVQRIKNIIRTVRQFEIGSFGSTEISTNVDPQQLLQHFTTKIGELSSDEVQPESILKTMKKLKKLAKVKDNNGNVTELRCPCCTRVMDNNEIVVFQQQIDNLSHPENSAIIQMDQNNAQLNRSAMRNYENWRNIIASNINDWLDHQRIADEIEILKATVAIDEDTLSSENAKLEEATDDAENQKEKHSNLLQLQDLVRRLRDEFNKIVNKKSQIATRKEELRLIAPRASGKNLRNTERDYNSKMEEKDALMHVITSLNQEATDLNERINQASESASRAENLVQTKMKQFEQDQEAIVKRKELNESIASCKEEESKMQDQIAPIRQKAKIKEQEKNKYRTAAHKELQQRSELNGKFNNDAEKISSLTKEIDDFKSGDSLGRLENIDGDINSISEDIVKKEKELRDLQPKLKAVQARVDDQGAHRRNIESNIELFDIISEKEKLNDEVSLLEKQLEALDGESIRQKYKASEQNIRMYESEKNRREGSKDALGVQQRELKRKLQTSHYKNIDERHRVKMIEHETSNLAVQDLDIYHSALDRALLRYHGLKIQEINKIIKELWSLTYKGEDITSIALTSDQEKSSRSARSYNYRVLMTKGTTELDMRGRCSAGQRVLASIVIRLALAETFCLNCGVFALDEPTTNLDFPNKRGLAIALAQIIAHRAAQDNFQLIVITHDEEFVGMMKNELSAHTGFAMPERYFQVSREEGGDGSYYSKIHAVDWDEL